ncbi:MAG: ferrous iron transport protein B [Acutalibacteraceae bacterium]
MKKTEEPKKPYTVLLAGNPNVGKSTVFNALTGMRQHTGNWTGKTVTTAKGSFREKGSDFEIVDLPGTYSLSAHSKEESVARDMICFYEYDAVAVVCDATTLERCLVLVLETLEVTNKVVVLVNLIDEAKKKKIKIHCDQLSEILKVPVIAASARSGGGLNEFRDALYTMCRDTRTYEPVLTYESGIEAALSGLEASELLNNRMMKTRLLTGDTDFIEAFETNCGKKLSEDQKLFQSIEAARKKLLQENLDKEKLSDKIADTLAQHSRDICRKVVESEKRDDSFDRRLDKVFTGKLTGIPIMLLLLALVFFITIYAANYPSELLSELFNFLGNKFRGFLSAFGTPMVVISMLIDGVWCVMTWVVSVMLPPMAIFFPLFTLLEDFGYLPRVAFNLDRCFKKCEACGKQCLCMCMGFGCNAAGVVGCRIIDSPRERLVAILTNNLVPCNGRFPTIIAIISMFFVCSLSSKMQPIAASLILTAVVLLSIAMTFLTSFFLSKTLLKGTASSFTLELPSYRVPKLGSVIVRSVFDRTLFVLGRAVVFAAPMGLVIWLLANIKVSGLPIISYASDFLDPIGRLMGLDGVILLAFILGFPANEIVLPIVLMCYLSGVTLTDSADLSAVFSVLSLNGWTIKTGICYILFSLFHFPCSTTLMTIKKETGSVKYTVLSAVLPTVIGFVLCCLVNFCSGLF